MEGSIAKHIVKTKDGRVIGLGSGWSFVHDIDASTAWWFLVADSPGRRIVLSHSEAWPSLVLRDGWADIPPPPASDVDSDATRAWRRKLLDVRDRIIMRELAASAFRTVRCTSTRTVDILCIAPDDERAAIAAEDRIEDWCVDDIAPSQSFYRRESPSTDKLRAVVSALRDKKLGEATAGEREKEILLALHEAGLAEEESVATPLRVTMSLATVVDYLVRMP